MTDQDTQRRRYQPLGPIPYNNTGFFQWIYVASLRASITTVPAAVQAPLTAAPTLITGMVARARARCAQRPTWSK